MGEGASAGSADAVGDSRARGSQFSGDVGKLEVAAEEQLALFHELSDLREEGGSLRRGDGVGCLGIMFADAVIAIPFIYPIAEGGKE